MADTSSSEEEETNPNSKKIKLSWNCPKEIFERLKSIRSKYCQMPIQIQWKKSEKGI